MRNILLVFLLIWTTSCIDGYDNVSEPPVGEGSEGPSIISTENGLLLSWQEPKGGETYLKMSVYDDNHWTEPITIAHGEDWFVNWADFPAIVANDNQLFVHFLKKSANGTYDYDVMYMHSSDFGSLWSKPNKLYTDTTHAEHGFVSAIAFEKGFYVTWLDGRNTKSEAGAMTLRGAFVNDKGEVAEGFEIDPRTCDCCQTALASVGGVPYSFYRDRSEEEIRDIYYTKLQANQWLEPASFHDDGWQIKGCPVNGPAVATDGNNVAVTWFTGVGGESSVNLKISTDGGENFGELIPVSRDETLGRVDVQINKESIYVTFLTDTDGETYIDLVEFSLDGKALMESRLATVKPDRGTGFPRTAIWNDNLVVTWTDLETSQVKVLSHSL